jgi:hypothetical protein
LMEVMEKAENWPNGVMAISPRYRLYHVPERLR